MSGDPTAALALSALAMSMGCKSSWGRGKGGGGMPNERGEQQVCFAFRDCGKCLRGDACRFKHALADKPVTKVTCGLRQDSNNDDDTDFNSYHFDHDEKDGMPGYATFKLTTTKGNAKALSLTKEVDGRTIALWTPTVAPPSCADLLKEYGSYVHEFALNPSGNQLGKQEACKIVQDNINRLKQAGYKPFALPSVAASAHDEKLTEMEVIMNRMIGGIEATNKNVASLAASMVVRQESEFQPARKQARSSTDVEMMFEGDLSGEDDEGEMGDGANDGQNNAPEQLAWNRLKRLATQTAEHMKKYKRPSPGQLLEWSEQEPFAGSLMYMKPTGEVDQTRNITYDVPQMGLFAMTFDESDFTNANNEVMAKLIEGTRLNKKPCGRLQMMLKAYGVEYSGKLTMPRALMGVALSIAKDRRVMSQPLGDV